MSSGNRKPYLTATVLDQELLDNCQDNLSCQLEMICEISTFTGLTPHETLYLSDRNKYVGGTFYEARMKFPPLKRTLGEWLSPTLEFSSIKLDINNADGKFNEILPEGSAYQGFIEKRIIIKLGLGELASSYQTIFSGTISEAAGVGRTVQSITLTARNDFNSLTEKFPTDTMNDATYVDIDPDINGQLKPVIYGDWTTEINLVSEASVPVFPINGQNAGVIGGLLSVTLIVSENVNSFFDTTKFVLLRSSDYFVFDAGDVSVNVDNNEVTLLQSGNGGTTKLDPTSPGGDYVYAQGDKFFCRCRGIDLGTYDDNVVEIARNILTTYGGADPGDFTSNWDTLRDKAAPAASAISAIKGRVWLQKPQAAITYALSMLEQIRCEAFVNRENKLDITTLHLEDFEANPSFTVRNWDVEKGAFKPEIDTRNNFNRAQGLYNRFPDLGENARNTKFLRNDAAITQTGKEITRFPVFPNLYLDDQVQDQVDQILRLSSAYFEQISVNLTWRSLLLDLGDFVALDVKIGATQFNKIPAIVRDVGYDAKGLKIVAKFWSLQLIPFPGYTPAGSGIVGGDTATITVE